MTIYNFFNASFYPFCRKDPIYRETDNNFWCCENTKLYLNSETGIQADFTRCLNTALCPGFFISPIKWENAITSLAKGGISQIKDSTTSKTQRLNSKSRLDGEIYSRAIQLCLSFSKESALLFVFGVIEIMMMVW